MAHPLTRPTSRPRSRRIPTVCVLLVGLASMWAGPATGQMHVTRQEDVKATYLYNFAKFVEWPQNGFGDDATAFRIEVIGRDPFDGRLEQLMIGKKMGDLPIEVIHSLGSPSARSVRIAFVSGSEDKRLDALLNIYREHQVLTVSDIPDFTQRGGMIGFKTDGGAVRFRINQTAADQSQLRVSSRLLALGQ